MSLKKIKIKKHSPPLNILRVLREELQVAQRNELLEPVHGARHGAGVLMLLEPRQHLQYKPPAL